MSFASYLIVLQFMIFSAPSFASDEAKTCTEVVTGQILSFPLKTRPPETPKAQAHNGYSIELRNVDGQPTLVLLGPSSTVPAFAVIAVTADFLDGSGLLPVSLHLHKIVQFQRAPHGDRRVGRYVVLPRNGLLSRNVYISTLQLEDLISDFMEDLRSEELADKAKWVRAFQILLVRRLEIDLAVALPIATEFQSSQERISEGTPHLLRRILERQLSQHGQRLVTYGSDGKLIR